MRDGVYLSGSCLFSKYGFGDGDMPDHLLDWLDDQHPEVDYSVAEWHPILCRLVRERLLPLMPPGLEVVEIGTIHNPIRATTVYGVDVEDLWYESDIPSEFDAFTSVSALVPFEDIVALILSGSTEGTPE